MQIVTPAANTVSENQPHFNTARPRYLWIELEDSCEEAKAVVFDDFIDERMDKRLNRLLRSLNHRGRSARVEIIETIGESRKVHYRGSIAASDIDRFYSLMHWWIRLIEVAPVESHRQAEANQGGPTDLYRDVA